MEIRLSTKLQQYFVFFPFSLAFLVLFFNNLNEVNPVIIVEGLDRLSRDLSKIGSSSQITNFSTLIILISLFINYFIFLNYKNFNSIQLNIESYLYNLLRLFFSNLFSITFSMYLLRIYVNRPRLLIYITIFTIFIFSFNFLVKKILLRKLAFNLFTIFLISSSLYYSFGSNLTYSLKTEVPVSNEEVSDIFIGKSYEDSNCYEWLGSEQNLECLTGAYVEDVQYFTNPINNVIKFKNNYYFISVDGKIYINNPNEIFLNIENQVRSRNELENGNEEGMFGLAFHPTENFFITSYTDMANNLIFRIFQIDSSNNVIYENSEIVFSVPSSINTHFGGNVIWSDHFKDFILSIGDMDQPHLINSFYNHEPIDTTSPRGKLLLLNSTDFSPELLASSNLNNSRKDIIGYGLRNPWQTLEYDGYLFVPDIGLGVEEELNVINLKDLKDQIPILFGWPYFEGSIDNDIKFSEIYLWDDSKPTSPLDFIQQNSVRPSLYYQHNTPEVYRAAIIGGGIITDKSSKYFEHYIFGDYLSKEIFAYDFKNTRLLQIPLPSGINSFITSVKIYDEIEDTIIITTGSDEVIKITLP
jgi:hypothetical protein